MWHKYEVKKLNAEVCMAVNATYLILFLIFVPQMRIKKFTTEPKNVAPEFFFCAFFKKNYLKYETIYNFCSFHVRWALIKKEILQFFVQEINMKGQHWLWH